MKTFKGSLRIASTEDVVPAEFGVDEGMLHVATGGESLGSWPIDSLGIDDTGTDVRMVLDGEGVVVAVTDHDHFMSTIDPPPQSRKERRRKVKQERPKVEKERPKVEKKRPKVKESPKVKKERPPRDIRGAIERLFMRETWQDWLSNRLVRWSIASFVVIGVALLALFATSGLGVILMLLGMFVLVIAGLAASEDLTAVAWMPAAISETTMVIAGVVALLVGGLLTVVG